MVVAYKRLEEDIFFKNSEEMNQYIMDNADKNWYFLEKTKGHFVDEGENYTWCMTVVKPVEGFSMGV